MHVIIAFLGSIVSLLWVLHRLAEMGIDFGGFNPMAWRRRRKWLKQHQANPIFGLDDPLDVTALLATAVAKAEGDMTGAEKQSLLDAFKSEFSMSDADAASLLNSSAHLLGRGDEIKNNLAGILKPSIDQFTPSQAQAAIGLLERIADADGSRSQGQSQLITDVQEIFAKKMKSVDKWGQPTA
ncbi:MAG: TerB family tellurite resistance protein [Pseudomonadota bacterium]